MLEADLHALLQQLAALAVVAVAAGWLTARWLGRRARADCGGACSRCEGASACKTAAEGAISPAEPPRGVRSPGLRVMQSAGPEQSPRLK